MGADFWTEAKVERLAGLVAAGGSAAKIAEALGCSRNAVIGKLLRLKGEAGRLTKRPSRPPAAAPQGSRAKAVRPSRLASRALR